MTQRQISHAPGQIPRCPAPCQRDPKHIHDKRMASAGGGHFIECCACDRRTSKSENFEAALQEWCRITNRKAPGTQADLLNQIKRPVRAIR